MFFYSYIEMESPTLSSRAADVGFQQKEISWVFPELRYYKVWLFVIKDKFYPPPIRKSPADFLQKKSSDTKSKNENESPRNDIVSKFSHEAGIGTHEGTPVKHKLWVMKNMEGLALFEHLAVFKWDEVDFRAPFEARQSVCPYWSLP